MTGSRTWRLAVAACAALLPVIPARPHRAFAGDPVRDGVRYGPSAMRYLVHRGLHIEQSVDGQDQAADLGVQIFVTATISGPADTDGYRATFLVDSMIADSGTPHSVADGFAKVRALVWAGRLGRRGEFRSAASPDTLPPAVAQLLGTFRDFLPRLPEDGAELGARWTDTLEATQHGSGTAMTRQAVLASTAAAWEQHTGVRSLRIETTGTYSVVGAGDNAGQPFALTGTGTASQQTFIAEDGRFLGGESRDSTTLTVTLPVQRLTIPMTQLLHSTIAVLP